MESGSDGQRVRKSALIESACAFVDSSRGGEERSIKALSLLKCE